MTDCDRLAFCARRLAAVLVALVDSDRRWWEPRISGDHRRVPSEIATDLGIIGRNLESLPPFWVEVDIEERSRRLLHVFIEISLPPKTPKTSGQDQRFTQFLRSLGQSDQGMKRKLAEFFCDSAQHDERKTIHEDCRDLVNRLSLAEAGEMIMIPSYIYHDSPINLSSHFNDGLYDSLRDFCTCCPEKHSEQAAELVPKPHPSRLCLAYSSADKARLTFLVSSSNFKYWQEVRLTITHETVPSEASQVVDRGMLCGYLVEQPRVYISMCFKRTPQVGLYPLRCNPPELQSAYLPVEGERLSVVLQKYQLSPRNKVILAYRIASAYWQYYDSDEMCSNWSIESIWLMPTGIPNDHAELPLRAYLTLPFDSPGHDRGLDKVEDDRLLVHKSPRILAMGILLLEIGLSKVFPKLPKNSSISHANGTLSIAEQLLETLQKVSWDGFHHKRFFDDAIKQCLYNEKFKRPVQRQNVVDKMAPPQPAVSPRQAFYKEVVARLAYLAKIGFKNPTEDVEPLKLRIAGIGVNDGQPMNKTPDGEFYAGSVIRPETWIDHLTSIHEYVERRRRGHDVWSPIRVAILDTGCHPHLETVEWKDYVVPNGPQVDTFGHGSLMAMLVRRCAPFAEIIMVRVAENTDTLGENRKNIEKAIRWAAGNECRADIISMSFGFSSNEQNGIIAKAIDDARTSRKKSIIFLAGAGNSVAHFENFPARHESVIAIYGTNTHGDFLHGKPRNEMLAGARLGTFGSDLPSTITDGMSKKYSSWKELCEPGSSIATAVTAGICATMLAYAAMLPSIPSKPKPAEKYNLGYLWSSEGMRKVLGLMGRETTDLERDVWIQPAIFFKDKPDDRSRYECFCDCLKHLDWEHERGALGLNSPKQDEDGALR
ncbi:S8 family Peptidase, partial [Metarhizium majus ARSEF 297]